MSIQIVELTAEFDLMTLRAEQTLKQADIVFLQSDRAEGAAEIMKLNESIATLDDLFATAEDFDILYKEGALRAAQEAEGKRVAFCILGDAGTNGFVRALEESGVQLEFVSGGGNVAAALTAARRFFVVNEYEVLDARRLGETFFDTQRALVVTGIDNANTAEGVKCALGDYFAEDVEGVLYAAGRVRRVKLYDMDRDVVLGTGGILILPGQGLCEKERYTPRDLVRIMATLRGENGCPWDKEQTHQTLRQYLLEEAYEAVDAIDADDIFALYDELGDVFLQVVFHAQIARECGEFDIDDVASAVCAKMIRRHPHIFGDGKANTAKEVVANWEAIKREEKQNETFVSVLRDVPRSLGAMMRAYKLQKKASAIGFDWNDPMQAFLKVEEELAEWKAELETGAHADMEEEAGDLLFAIINVLRLKKTNPELCLNKTCEKFIERLEFMEKNAKRELGELPLSQLDELWNRAKREKVDKTGKKY